MRRNYRGGWGNQPELSEVAGQISKGRGYYQNISGVGGGKGGIDREGGNKTRFEEIR